MSILFNETIRHNQDKNPQKTKELISATKGMKNEQLDLLISVARGLKK